MALRGGGGGFTMQPWQRRAPLPVLGAKRARCRSASPAAVASSAPAVALVASATVLSARRRLAVLSTTPTLRATRGGTGETEAKAVGDAAMRTYRVMYARFQEWVQRFSGPVPTTAVRLDPLLVDYFDALLAAGSPTHEAEKTLAATRVMHPSLTAKLSVVFPRASRALAGFKKACPARSRLPMPFMITAANVVTMAYLQPDLQAALKLLVMHVTYLRPCEATGLRVADLLPPASARFPGLDSYALMVCPVERGKATKAQAFDDTLLLDKPAALGPLLFEQLARNRSDDSPLFEIEHLDFLALWQRCQKVVGLTGQCIYQVRHGGASEDVVSGSRQLLEVMVRGRWAAVASLKRYAKAGKLQKLVATLRSEDRDYCEWAAVAVMEVLEGRIPAVPPPSMGGSASERKWPSGSSGYYGEASAMVAAEPLRRRASRAVRRRPAAAANQKA